MYIVFNYIICIYLTKLLKLIYSSMCNTWMLRKASNHSTYSNKYVFQTNFFRKICIVAYLFESSLININFWALTVKSKSTLKNVKLKSNIILYDNTGQRTRKKKKDHNLKKIALCGKVCITFIFIVERDNWNPTSWNPFLVAVLDH